MKSEQCIWRFDPEGYWQPGCDKEEAFLFTVGGPAENNFRFCPYCGKPLVTITRG